MADLPKTADPTEDDIDTTSPVIDPDELMLPDDGWAPNESTGSQPLRLGLDCIDPNVLAGLQFYWCAGYVGGYWPDYHPLALRYPALAKAGRVKSYAVTASEDADWLDCEVGDATVAQCRPWVMRQFARGHKRPGVYANWARWSSEGLADELASFGSSIVRIVAHYTFVPAIAHAGYDVQQYTDRYAGRNIDGNVALDSVFNTPKPVVHPVVNQPHYDRFPTGPFPSAQWGALNERLVVEEYDGARKEPVKYKYYLPQVESKLKWLADRVANIAINQQPHTSPVGYVTGPSWDVDWRGWRYQQLAHRAQGMRFV